MGLDRLSREDRTGRVVSALAGPVRRYRQLVELNKNQKWASHYITTSESRESGVMISTPARSIDFLIARSRSANEASDDWGFAVITTSHPAAAFIPANAFRIRRLTRFRVTALPTRLLTERPTRIYGRWFGSTTTLVKAFEDRRPREKTWRNSAGRLIRCLVGSDTEYDLLNGEPHSAFSAATCENRTAALGVHT